MRRNGFHIWLVCVLLALTISKGRAQFYVHESFDNADGLYSGHVLSLLQDRNGYIWVGTASGVSRYDGYRFENFDRYAGISNQRVTAMAEAEDGTIWFAGGVALFAYNGDEVIEHHVIDDTRGYTIRKVAAGENGDVFFCFSTSLWHYNSVSGQVERLTYDPQCRVITGLAYHKGQLVVATETKILVYNGTEPEIVWTIPEDEWHTTHFHRYTEDTLLFSTVRNSRLYRYVDGRVELHQKDSHPEVYYGYGAHFKPGRKYVQFNDKIQRLTEDGLQDAYILPDDDMWINTFMVDREGNLWVGSSNGLIKISESPFHHFSKAVGDGLDEVYSMLETGDGNYLFGGNRAKLKSFDADSMKLTGEKRYAPKAEAFDLIYDRKGAIWMATGYDGLVRIVDTTGQRMTEEDGIPDNTCFDLFMDSRHIVWVGHEHGLSRFTYNENSGEYELDRDLAEQDNMRIAVRAIVEDHQGRIWLGTNTGLFTWSDGQMVPANRGLKTVVISSMKLDHDGVLWMASRETGIYKMGLQGDSPEVLKHYGPKELGSPYFLDLAIDKNNNVWAGNFRGLVRINESHPTVEVRAFNIRDGFAQRAYSYLKMQTDSRGWIWTLTNSGIVRFDPLEVLEQSEHCILNLGRPKLFEGAEDISDYYEDGKLILPYDKNFITIPFVAISHKNPSHIRYRYKLVGFDDRWRETDQAGTAVYNNLPPGEYTLKVQATNSSGVWNPETKTYSFTITPPFWEKTWFIVSAIALVVLILFLVIRFRERGIKRKANEAARIEKIISDLEIRALRAQMNPHFMFNALNAIQECIMTEQVDTAYHYLSKFSRLLRLILENSESEKVPLEAELKMLELYVELESLRFEGEFHYEFEVEDQLLHNPVAIPPMLVQPLVENSIWHGLLPKDGDRRLTVGFKLQDELLKCVVDDNGIGREAARKRRSRHLKEHESKGLQLVYERLDVLNRFGEDAKMVIEDKINGTDALGTRIELSLPVNY